MRFTLWVRECFHQFLGAEWELLHDTVSSSGMIRYKDIVVLETIAREPLLDRLSFEAVLFYRISLKADTATLTLHTFGR